MEVDACRVFFLCVVVRMIFCFYVTRHHLCYSLLVLISLSSHEHILDVMFFTISIEHSVYNHTLVKPDLTLSEYRQFHRPRLTRFAVQASRPWQFQTRVITAEKKPRGAAAGVDGSIVIGSYHAMMSAGNKAQNKLRNEADLSPSMGDLVVLEYSEERPPLFMTKGTTARIVNYYRGDRAR